MHFLFIFLTSWTYFFPSLILNFLLYFHSAPYLFPFPSAPSQPHSPYPRHIHKTNVNGTSVEGWGRVAWGRGEGTPASAADKWSS